MKNKNITYIAVCFVLTVVVVVIVLSYTGLVSLWKNGIGFVANSTETYTHKGGYLLKGSYSLELDLSSLESNIGKEIYNDGEHKIFVSSFHKTKDGVYNVGFRSSGQYSLSGATLISALFHEAINDQSFTTSTTAKITIEENEKLYDVQITGQCGLNYKDGDCFSFSFALTEEANIENTKDAGIIKLTITDLYKNIWRKK